MEQNEVVTYFDKNELRNFSQLMTLINNHFTF